MIISIYKVHSKKFFIPLAWLIKINQKTKWHHYAIGFKYEGINYVTDAKGEGVRLVTRSLFSKEYTILEEVNITLPCNEDAFRSYVNTKLGTKYGFIQLFGIFLITIGLLKHNPWGKNSKFLVCHEYVVTTLARWLKIDVKDSDDYTFKMVDELLKEVKK